MKRSPCIPSVVSTLMVAGAALGALAPVAAAAPVTQDDYVIVTFADPPAIRYAGGIAGLVPTRAQAGRFDPTSPATKAYVRYLQDAHGTYRSWLSGKAPAAVVMRELVLTINALAVQLNGTRASLLAQGPNVSSVTYSALYRPAMNVSAGLIGAPSLWPGAGGRAAAGAGVRVGIIDTGIDDSHPFFACKHSVPHRVYASGVAFDTSKVLVFDHGTHVAGTVAGCLINLTRGPIRAKLSGVAPGASLHDYNVFPGFGAGFVAFGGSALTHDIAAALEDAVVEGMHVVNMSLGGGVSGPHDVLADAVNAAVEAGLVVAVAAGNSGPGDATVESPGSAAGALTAGASSNPHFIGASVVSGGSTFGAAVGAFNPFAPPVAAGYTITAPADACTSTAGSLAGMIALIDRGACTFTTKIRNAQAAGALGTLLVNNVAGDPVSIGHDGTDPLPTIPAAMLSMTDGNSLKPTGTASVDGTSLTEFSTTNADILAGFSSRGPSPYTFLIKPDVTAPGVNVYSSVFETGFAMFQGTSMATPHLAGSAALLLDLHPDWSPADVKSALVNTAARVVTDHLTGTVDPGVLARGGGRVDLATAASAPLAFDPASASFGRWTGNVDAGATVRLAVRNLGGTSLTCSVTVTGPGPVSSPSSSLGLAAGGSTALDLVLSAGRATQTGSGDFSGDVEVACGRTLLRVPWWVRIDREAKP